MTDKIPVKTDDGEVIGEVIDVREEGLSEDRRSAVVPSEDIASLRGIVADLQRDSRIPPWRTPEGRAEKARLRRNRAQKAARKRARRS